MKPDRALLRMAWVELSVGLMAAGAGIAHTIWALPRDLHTMLPSAQHGVALLGCVIVLRAIADIGVNFHWAGSFGDKVAHESWVRLRGILTHKHVESAVGLLVILAGFGEAYQVAVVGSNQVYHWGVVLIGLMMFCRASLGMVEGVEKLEHAGLVHRHAWGRKVARAVHHPVAMIALASALFILAGAEALLPDAPGTADDGMPIAAHGMVMLAGLHLMRGFFDLSRGAKLVWDTTHAAPHHVPEPE
jgi:hypothetical protein